MKNYCIKYVCDDGHSDTLYFQAENDLAAHKVCQEIFTDISENIVCIICYLEEENA